MSSGEAEAMTFRLGLDAWIRCDIPGCRLHVPLPATRCRNHGGPYGPAYETGAFGDVIYHWMSGDSDSEPHRTQP